MNKACPVVLRSNKNDIEILAFIHPLAGNQLVKGTIELGETLEDACIRELEEEAGLKAQVIEKIGVWNANHENQEWGFCLMECEAELSETWEYFTLDDGGHIFKFFWQPISSTLNSEWHSVYKEAIKFIHQAIGNKYSKEY